MRVVVAYESMFGNTRTVAEAVAAELASKVAVVLTAVAELPPDGLSAGDVLVIGAPTHVHGLPRQQSRAAAVEMQTKDTSLRLDPHVEEHGVKEWLAEAALHGVHAAAFDTRMHGPRVFTGSAARSIARQLRRRGADVIGPPGSFLVQGNALMPGELERARAWGARLALLIPAGSVTR